MSQIANSSQQMVAPDLMNHPVQIWKVISCNSASLLDDAGHVDAVHVLGACLGGEHGEDAGAAAHVEHDLALEEVLVVPHRVAVGQGPHLLVTSRHYI